MERVTALMEDETVQIVLEGADTVVGPPLRDFLKDYLNTLIQDKVPEIVEIGLDSIFEPLQNITIGVDDRTPLGAASVDFSLLSANPRVVPDDALYFELDAEMREANDVVPQHETPGIPSFDEGTAPIWHNGRRCCGLGLSVLNALLDSLWRQGLYRQTYPTTFLMR